MLIKFFFLLPSFALHRVNQQKVAELMTFRPSLTFAVNAEAKTRIMVAESWQGPEQLNYCYEAFFNTYTE